MSNKNNIKTDSNYYSNTRPEIIDLIPKHIETILDVGCGKGEFLKLVKAKTNADTWGVESENHVAKHAEKNVDNIICGKIEEVINNLTDGYFDCITFNDVLEHLLNPKEVIEMLMPKLKPDGIIIASIPNVRFFHNLVELLVKKDWEYREEGILDSTHLRFFTFRSMQRLFTSCGLKLKLQKGINPTPSVKFKIFNILTIGYFKDTRYCQFVNVASLK